MDFSLLLSNKLKKMANKLSIQKAKITEKEDNFVERFYNEISTETILKIFEMVEKKGHPKEKKEMEIIKKRYNESGLNFDDIIKLDKLYKSNYQ